MPTWFILLYYYSEKYLNKNGIRARAYHAGLINLERQSISEEFENSKILLATIAF